MRITATSDIHGTLPSSLPTADVLTISGDICPVKGSHAPTAQLEWINRHFFPWCAGQIASGKFKHVVFTPGNHDFVFAKAIGTNRANYPLALPPDVHFLVDQSVVIDGVTFYGTPWSNKFGNWAFMAEEQELERSYRGIPEGVDVLLSHGPAQGWGDTIMQRGGTEHLGSHALSNRIMEQRPKWALTGHIHGGDHEPSTLISNGSVKWHTRIVNVSMTDEDYKNSYPAFQFEIGACNG